MTDDESLTNIIEKYLRYIHVSLNNLTIPTANKDDCISSFHAYMHRIEMYGDGPYG